MATNLPTTMSKKQTRRTLSLERKLFEETKHRAGSLDKSASEYVSELIRQDLVSAGIEPPPFKHASGSEGSGIAIQIPPVEYIKSTFAPPVEVSTTILPPHDSDAAEKWEYALKFTREMLARGATPKVIKGCNYCKKPFQIGEIPQSYKDQRVHGRCKREIARLPDSQWP